MHAEPTSKLKILQVNTLDLGGGAERIAWNLFKAYQARGHSSWLAVGNKRSNDSDVFEIPRTRGIRREPLPSLIPFAGVMQAILERRLGTTVRDALGVEEFDYPGSRQLLNLLPAAPDIVHAHNLHGWYFDLRYLAELSQRAPLAMTLHDAWLLSGHCAHSFECGKWQTGCGNCPHLDVYPPVRRDATAFNWRRKKNIYRRARLHIATPCQWLMDKVEHSMLMPAVASQRVIPNGIDTSVFTPGDKLAARSALGIPATARVLLFSANGIKKNPWKDYKTMRAAVERISSRFKQAELWFMAVGESAADEQIGNAKIRFIPFVSDQAELARYYRAADIYLHAARADTFPNTVLEALACGTPVVATAVGGIPEQVQEGETGFLVPLGDPEALAARCELLIEDEPLRQTMGHQAAEQASERFCLERQVDAYLDWYREILAERKRFPKPMDQ